MLYLRVRDWAENYETAETRKLASLRWVALPNKQDGDGYCSLLDDQDGPAHLGVWTVILQLASKCCVRGLLVREMGENRVPHDAKTIARITRMPVAMIEAALPRILEIGWLERVEVSDETLAGTLPADAGSNPGLPGSDPGRPVQKGREGEGKEKKGKEGEGEPTPPNPSGSTSASPGDTPTAKDSHVRLLALLRSKAVVLEIRGKPIFDEWARACRGFSFPWITRMLDQRPSPVMPSDLRALFKKFPEPKTEKS